MKSFANIIYDVLRFIFYKFFSKTHYKNEKTINYILSKEERLIFKHIKKEGYAVIENFFSKEKCDEIIKEIELFCNTRPLEVTKLKEFDNRIYGFNYASKNAELFLNNKKLIRILQSYSGKKKLSHSFTLAQKTVYKDSNTSSKRPEIIFNLKNLIKLQKEYLSPLDLKEYAYKQLLNENIPDINIDISRICTFESNHDFHSWRRSKTLLRQWNFISS